MRLHGYGQRRSYNLSYSLDQSRQLRSSAHSGHGGTASFSTGILCNSKFLRRQTEGCESRTVVRASVFRAVQAITTMLSHSERTNWFGLARRTANVRDDLNAGQRSIVGNDIKRWMEASANDTVQDS
jgi:hypothetical protein